MECTVQGIDKIGINCYISFGTFHWGCVYHDNRRSHKNEEVSLSRFNNGDCVCCNHCISTGNADYAGLRQRAERLDDGSV